MVATVGLPENQTSKKRITIRTYNYKYITKFTKMLRIYWNWLSCFYKLVLNVIT
jgi:hypothetical protein